MALPKRLVQLFEGFDKAARAWGWETDQGSGEDETAKCKAEYGEAKQKLLAYLNRKLRADKKRARPSNFFY